MNCTTFRENHGSFVDDVLGDAELVAMHCHLAECAACAAYDTRVRRGMLLFRNLAPIEPSPDFAERLSVRLYQERRRAAHAATLPRTVASSGPGFGVFAAAAASVVVIAYLTTATAAHRAAPLALPPVVATRLAEPEPVDPAPSPVSSPVVMASVGAGMPIWPTALLVDEAPLRFASSEFQLTSYGR